MHYRGEVKDKVRKVFVLFLISVVTFVSDCGDLANA